MNYQELLAVSYGMGAALSWGTGDFSGGIASKTSGALGVVLFSYMVGICMLLVFAIVQGSPIPDTRILGLGIAAGVTSVLGLTSLYRGLASGRMSIVAPVAAVVTAAVPVLFGMAVEGVPGNLKLAGFLAAFAAIWLLCAPDREIPLRLKDLKLPLVAGVSFGISFIFIDRAAEVSVLWPLIVAKGTGVLILLSVFTLRRMGTRPRKKDFPLIFLAGVLDSAGGIFFALAASTGRLDIAAVLSSMYPAGTVLLAWLVLKESLSSRRMTGILAALIALVLIAS
ncbi:MAG: EamA family transporter [Desulfovibrionales bacterium]